MPLQPPGSQVDSVTSVLTHRSTKGGDLEFLCLKVEWHPYSELKRRVPQLLTHYVHHASFQHSPRGRKRRAVSEVPLMSKHPKTGYSDKNLEQTGYQQTGSSGEV